MLRIKTSPPATSPWPDSVWYILTILIFITLVSTAGYVMIQQQKQYLLGEKQKEIATIAELKTSQLVQWRKERFAEGASIRANTMMAHRINDDFTGSNNTRVRHEFRLWMSNLIDLGEYSRGILFTPAGEVITSDSDLKVTPSQHYFNLVAETAKEHELILSNFHRDYIGDPYTINLAIPIMRHDGVYPRCVAVLVLDIDPVKRLYPLIQSWPTTNSSAETLLVMREGDAVLILNELHYRKNTPAQYLIPLSHSTVPAVRAALGQEGNFEGVDYRNAAVLSAVRIIPGTRWGLVTKIDINEVLAPIEKYIWMVMFLGVVVIIAMILGVFLWGIRKKAESLRKLYEIQIKTEAELQAIHLNQESQISERTRDLTEINSLLRAEVSERMQLEQQLLSAKQLEAIGQIAGGVAHEVRNPLNAILTITEALFREQEIGSNPELEPYILHIRTQVNRLVQLMNDLLDLGRTIPVTNLQPMPLYEICRETIDFWKSTGMSINKMGLLTSENDDMSIWIMADALKLQQVFFNLLENAGHHTPDGSRIMVQLTRNAPDKLDDMAVVQVIDQGSGIAEDKLPHVFEPFYTNRKGGTGLGLALVRHFIENMGGTVQIWNNNPPPGCTVEVRIPLYREELE